MHKQDEIYLLLIPNFPHSFQIGYFCVLFIMDLIGFLSDPNNLIRDNGIEPRNILYRFQIVLSTHKNFKLRNNRRLAYFDQISTKVV